jgi:hypothetical protein
VDPYHRSGTDVRLCLFCVLSGADKKLATGRPFVQAFTSRPRYPETQQVLGSIVPEALQTAEDSCRILTANAINAIAYLYLQEYIMGYIRKEMVLKYRSGKGEMVEFAPKRFLPVNNHIRQTFSGEASSR